MDAELQEVHDARIRALVSGDLDALDRYVDDDLTYISPHGKRMGKPDVFDAFRNGKMTVDSMELSDLRCTQQRDAAILTYRAKTRFSDHGTIVDTSVQSTAVYLRRDGDWKLVAAQQTAIVDEN